MKTVVIYYSLTGNAAYVADAIADYLKCDRLELKPQKAYPAKGARKFLWGGKSAVMSEAPELEPFDFDPAAYDRAVLVTPVWAGTFAPPLRTFARQYGEALRGKTLAAAACSSGGRAEKALDKLAAALGAGPFADRVSLVDPHARPDLSTEEKLALFCQRLNGEIPGGAAI